MVRFPALRHLPVTRGSRRASPCEIHSLSGKFHTARANEIRLVACFIGTNSFACDLCCPPRRLLNYSVRKSSFRTSGTLSFYIDVRYRASTFEDFGCIVLHRTTWDCQRLHCTKHPLNDTKRHVKSNSLDGASYIELSPQRWPILHTRSHTTSIIGLPDPIFIGSILVFLRVCTIGLSEARRAN